MTKKGRFTERSPHVCSANADKELKKKLASAERILKLGELCRKLETEQEKVLPFCSPEQALGLQALSDQEEARQLEAEASAAGLDDSDNQVHTVEFLSHAFKLFSSYSV